MFRKILFPTDFSEGAYRAAKHFEKTNTVPVGEVVLLHVINEETLEELLNGYSLLYNDEELEIEAIKEELMKKTMEKLQAKVEDVKKTFGTENVKPLVRFGLPWEEIVKVADEEDVSLILLPSHGKLGFSHELLGSTTVRVLRKTKKPVLVIKTHPECRGDGE
ncbi:universal stress protein [Thermococcus guaymasensis DSM 11113]|uniref:Universal stress protein n=1 Tax=Thermococcus guaymasensis DSM 11113 TaxID=1432656 RepID=A0A0X1KME6_9EURY|nr:universal stress protein [Thermococcus guaymasensis]AJC72428.1 universal stress protein [Thermococcus guaymasensis DSM 11113]